MAVVRDRVEPDLQSVLHSMGCTHVPPRADLPARDATDPGRTTGVRWLFALARGVAIWSPHGIATTLASMRRSSRRA